MVTLNIDEKNLEEIIDKIVGRFAFKIHRVLIERFPKSFMNKISVVRTSEGWIIGSNDEIFIYFESGTRPHEIRANFKKALNFKWPKNPKIMGQPDKNGKYTFKKVKHPGTKGKHILDEIENDEELLKGLLQESIDEVLV